MTVGIAYNGLGPFEDFLRLVQACEQIGLESVWLTEEITGRDSMVSAARVLQATTSTRVIPGPISPYLRHPIVIGREVLSLAELAGSRLGLHLGTGDIRALAEMGVRPVYPLSTMSRAVHTIRSLCQEQQPPPGDQTHQRGNMYVDIPTRHRIPIYMAAMGPKMLALSRKIADGTVLSGLTSLAYMRHCLEVIREANAPGPHESVGILVVSLAESREEAYAQVRPIVAPWLSVAGFHQPHRMDWAMNSLAVAHEAISRAIQNGDMARACHLVTDQVISTLTASGTLHEVQERIAAYLHLGIDHLVLVPAGALDNVVNAVRAAVEAMLYYN